METILVSFPFNALNPRNSYIAYWVHIIGPALSEQLRQGLLPHGLGLLQADLKQSIEVDCCSSCRDLSAWA